MPNVKSRNR